MKKRMRVMLASVLALSLVGAFALFGCSGNEQKAEEPAASEQAQEPAEESHEAVELQIFAANSLSEAMDEAMEAYTADHDWVTFKESQYLSSGNLVEELEGGAYADVFISASSGKMNDAEEKDLVDPATRFDLYDNDLVVVAKAGSGIEVGSLEDIVSGGYSLAVGDDSVPAGNYAAQSLYTIGAYDNESGKGGSYVGITPTTASKVGDVAQYVSSGEVDLGIVFLSDTYRYDGVEVVYTIPADAHEAIIYPAAVCAVSENAEAAAEFLDWCANDPAAEEIWQKWGLALAA